jgi:beta-lactamase class A
MKLRRWFCLGESRAYLVAALLLPLLPPLVTAQTTVQTIQPSPASEETALQRQIREIAADAHGKVSVACALPGASLNCDLNPHAHPPMQSVFKLPLAMAVMQRVDQGKLRLDQPVRFLASDRILPHVYSPLQTQYPEANIGVSLRELLRLNTTLSDNIAADILLRLIGGPAAVQAYMDSLEIRGFHIEDSERELHAEVAAQYRNWFEPAAAVALLRRLSDHSPLTPASTALILDWMHSTRTKRLEGDLPAGTLVAHKSGTSDVEKGVAFATNDIALITLPDGRQFAVAVFLTDAMADDVTRDKVIARIGKAAYDAAVATTQHGKGEKTMKQAKGSFEVKVVPVESSAIGKQGGVGRMTIDKVFSGDMVGTTKGEMLTSATESTGAMAYVAVETVTATLDGRSGTFVFLHDATIRKSPPKSQSLHIIVAPDSGTSELAGISGTFVIDIDAAGKHSYTFDYELP